VGKPSPPSRPPRACEIGRRRADLADSTIKAHVRKLTRELDSLLERQPTNAEGRHLRDAIIVNARDKLLVFLTRRDVEPTNNGSERTLRPSVIFRKVRMASAWSGARSSTLISAPLSQPAASTAGAPSLRSALL
jgi:Transposase IS66 family